MSPGVASSPVSDDGALLDGLRAGDEGAFVALVRAYQPALLRLAEATVGSHAVAQEITQDTWLAVLRSLDRFEGRSSLKTWLFRILLNRARSAAGREQRAGRPEVVDDERFERSGAWVEPPESWADRVDDQLDAAELARKARVLLAELPDAQRQVLVLRDIEALPADVVAELLSITDGNQRVLLHRARARLRHLLALEMTSR
jgi:RNA polymerase sigma-70 factor (ECF subfamily)